MRERLKVSTVLSVSDAGSVIHTHSKHAVMATLLCPGKEFKISNIEMIKGITKCKSSKSLNWK